MKNNKESSMIIANNLKRLRNRNKISQRKLAELVGVTNTAIYKFEKGILIPDSKMLIKISKALNVKIAAFFEQITPINLKNIEFRNKSKLSKRDEEIVYDITKDYLRKYIDLMNVFPEDRFKFISKTDLIKEISTYDEIENKVLEIRKELNLGLEPIQNLLELVENQLGIIVIFIEDINSFDGMEGNVEKINFIVLKKDISGERQRFSLAHELGHLLIKDSTGKLNKEKIADRFAGAFLAPKESLINDLGDHRNSISLYELQQMKIKYKMSMQAITYRCNELKIINDNQAKSIFSFFKKNKYKKKEPIKLENEESNRFIQMLCEAVTENYISITLAGDYLNIPAYEFAKKYLGSGIEIDAENCFGQ